VRNTPLAILVQFPDDLGIPVVAGYYLDGDQRRRARNVLRRLVARKHGDVGDSDPGSAEA